MDNCAHYKFSATIKAAMNLRVQISPQQVWSSLGICPGVRQQAHMLVLLIFEKSTELLQLNIKK